MDLSGKKPDYETAFVFLHKTENMKLVPDWAIWLIEQEGVVKNMNIKDAKNEIIHTLLAYNLKDAAGIEFIFPILRQRPILLIGPPVIGKTADYGAGCRRM